MYADSPRGWRRAIHIHVLRLEGYEPKQIAHALDSSLRAVRRVINGIDHPGSFDAAVNSLID